MRKNTFTMSLAAMAVAALMGRATATAQTASPYYTGVCEVDPQATSTVVVGNVLSFLEKREFPNKKESLTDEEKQSADLGIGGTYYGDYYTVALNVTEPGAYKIEFDAAHKDQERSLWLYRSATSLPATPQAGDTDEGVEYIEVGEKQMPITGGWTTYEPLTFELDLLEGVNYVKFVFDDRYGGNIGGMRIMRNIPPSPALKTLTVGGVDVLASLDEDGTYTLSLPEAHRAAARSGGRGQRACPRGGDAGHHRQPRGNHKALRQGERRTACHIYNQVRACEPDGRLQLHLGRGRRHHQAPGRRQQVQICARVGEQPGLQDKGRG